MVVLHIRPFTLNMGEYHVKQRDFCAVFDIGWGHAYSGQPVNCIAVQMGQFSG